MTRIGIRLETMFRLAFLVLASGGASGCAISTGHVNLAYTSQTAGSVLPGADRTTIGITVLDERSSHRDRVSVKKNGYGMEMASIVSDTPVTDVIKDAITQEVRRQGFVVGASPIMLTVGIEQFFNDFKVGFFSSNANGQVVLSARVLGQNGTILYAHDVTGSSDIGGVQIMGADNAKLALDQALSDAVARLVSDPALDTALLKSGSMQGVPAF